MSSSYDYSAVNREDIGGRVKRKSPKDRVHGREKIEKVMHEFKEGDLKSGSKHGKKVKSRKQAIAIALSEQRKQNKGGY